MIDPRDVECMAHAIRLAKRGRFTTRPNPNVGCVITNSNGELVGSGFHQRAGEAHAEIVALRQAGERAKGSTAYITLEPCCHQGKTGPCTDAIIRAGVKRVVVAMQDPNPVVTGKGIQQLRDHNVDVEVDVLNEQARRLNRGFIKRMESGLPWLCIKSAISLDGRTALHTGDSKWITSPAARNDVQKLRAEYDAIMTGIGTVQADDPSLNVRINAQDVGADNELMQPLRVVVDSKLQTPPSAKMLSLVGKTMIFTNSSKAVPELDNHAACQIVRLDDQAEQVDLQVVLKILAENEINSVLIEAGSTLVGNLIQNKLADELIVYVSPKLFGSAAKGISDLDLISDMKEHIALQFTDVRTVDTDLRITASFN